MHGWATVITEKATNMLFSPADQHIRNMYFKQEDIGLWQTCDFWTSVTSIASVDSGTHQLI